MSSQSTAASASTLNKISSSITVCCHEQLRVAPSHEYVNIQAEQRSQTTTTDLNMPEIQTQLLDVWRLFPDLFVFGQTLSIAQSLAAAFQLQQQRFAMAVGGAVCTAGHGQVVDCTETRKAGVAAQLMDGTIQDHLVFALCKR